jgi:tripartite motif-containing protein 71
MKHLCLSLAAAIAVCLALPGQVSPSTFQSPHFLYAIGSQAPVGQFNGAAGVATAPDGTVYVADNRNHRVQHFTASGTFLDMWGSGGSGPGQFSFPRSIAAAPDGTVYVSDTNNHRIQRFTADGRFLSQWGGFGDGEGRFRSPLGVAVVGGEGCLYTDAAVFPTGACFGICVADSGNKLIQCFNPDGQFEYQWGGQGTGDGEFGNPVGIAASDGMLYVTDSGNNRVQVFTWGGVFKGAWGGPGTGDGQFREPADIAIDGLHRVYVVDSWNHRVQAFTEGGAFLRAFGSGHLGLPSGLTVDREGHLYVGEYWGERVSKYSGEGELLLTWGSHGGAAGQIDPQNVGIGADGTIYVVDGGDSRIEVFAPGGTFVGEWRNGLITPLGVALDAKGEVYVTDRATCKVHVFQPDSTPLREWGGPGSEPGRFTDPWDVAVGPDGTVYVADGANSRVQHFTRDGQLLGIWGSHGLGDSQFIEPAGLGIDPQGLVYVADLASDRIQRFTPEGAYAGSIGSREGSEGRISSPTDVALLPDGEHGFLVLVVERFTPRVQAFAPSGEYVGQWGEEGSGIGQFRGGAHGIAVGPDRLIYVADTTNMRVQVFGPAVAPYWHGEFFANRWLAGPPALLDDAQVIDFDWAYGSPSPKVPYNQFSARWQRTAWLAEGWYRFTVRADEGARLWVDEDLVIEAWRGQPLSYSSGPLINLWQSLRPPFAQGGGSSIYTGYTRLSSGYHDLRLDYYEDAGYAQLQLDMTLVERCLLPLVEVGGP